MSDPAPPPAPAICAFESRRSHEICDLIRRAGGVPTSAPSMREIPLEENPAGLQAIRQLIAGEFDALVLLTGVGTEALFQLAEGQGLLPELLQHLARIPLLVRGPKPAAVLSRYQLRYTIRAPEPNTWKELVAALDDSSLQLSGMRLAVQEYGVPGLQLYEALQQRGAVVKPIAVYRWALPLDTQPLIQALHQICAGHFQALLFTSANQLNSVLQIAAQEQLLPQLLQAVNSGTLVASIGPSCSEALLERGWPVHLEASPPKMGPLVRHVMTHLTQQQQPSTEDCSGPE